MSSIVCSTHLLLDVRKQSLTVVASQGVALLCRKGGGGGGGRGRQLGHIVNLDIFACIHFREFMKMGNFACIKIRVFFKSTIGF